MVFPLETKRPLPNAVELTDVGVVLRYDVFLSDRVPCVQLPQEPAEEAPVGGSTGGRMAADEGQTQAGDVSPPGGADSVQATGAVQQPSELGAMPPAGVHIATATSAQPQPASPPAKEVG